MTFLRLCLGPSRKIMTSSLPALTTGTQNPSRIYQKLSRNTGTVLEKLMLSKLIMINFISLSLSFFLSLSLSLRSSLICGVKDVCGCFSTSLYPIFGASVTAYFSNHSPFLRKHIFVGFNQFPGALSSIITGHRRLLFFEE